MNALHLCVLMFDCITYGEFYFYTRITFLRDSNDEDTYNFLFRTIFFRVIASTRITLSKLRSSKKSELCMLSIPTSNGIFMPKKYNKHLMTVYACVCVMCAYVCALNMNSQHDDSSLFDTQPYDGINQNIRTLTDMGSSL